MPKSIKRSDLKKQLWKIDLARSSARNVSACCEYFIANKPERTSPLFSALLTAICVGYAKPFTNNATVGMLSDKFARYSSPQLQRFHKSLLKFRDNYYAHQSPDGRKLHLRVEAKDMGDEIQYKFYPQAEVSHLHPDRIPDVLQMCKEQEEKLKAKFTELMDALYGKEQPCRCASA